MRERLKELICEVIQTDECISHCNHPYCGECERLADHLLANGVIVPTMRLGQACFHPCGYLNKVDECRVSSITQKADGSFKIRLTNLRGRWVFEITADEIGKTVFLTREEAEKALVKMKGEET